MDTREIAQGDPTLGASGEAELPKLAFDRINIDHAVKGGRIRWRFFKYLQDCWNEMQIQSAEEAKLLGKVGRGPRSALHTGDSVLRRQ